MGTTNARTYLFDETGNRRFWPLKTKAIDLPKLTADRDQLWAEAAVAEAEGESIELPKKLWLVAEKEQEERLATDPWTDFLRDYVDGYKTYYDRNGTMHHYSRLDRVHTSDLISIGLGIEPSRQSQQLGKRVKDVMTSLGWHYKRGMRIEGRSGAGYYRDGAPAEVPGTFDDLDNQGATAGATGT
jgi:predicted P-loop ATPase